MVDGTGMTTYGYHPIAFRRGSTGVTCLHSTFELTCTSRPRLTPTMARPLRVELAGAWYHITARGNERRAIFRSERDREHFLGDAAHAV